MDEDVKAGLIGKNMPTAIKDDLRLIEGFIEDDGRDGLVRLLEKIKKEILQREARRERAGREG